MMNAHQAAVIVATWCGSGFDALVLERRDYCRWACIAAHERMLDYGVGVAELGQLHEAAAALEAHHRAVEDAERVARAVTARESVEDVCILVKLRLGEGVRG
jgi:hypothetical protein